MECANYMCIYWADKKCTLDRISLDFRGSCEECICVNFEEGQIEAKRKEMLAKYNVQFDFNL